MNIKANTWGPVFIVTSLIGTCIFLIIPYVDVLIRSFMTTTKSEFVGISNYSSIFENQAFQLAMKNTFSFIGICIPLLIMISLAVAIFIYNHSGIGQWLKTGLLVPMAIPVASIVLLWSLIFDENGFFNSFLSILNIEGQDWMRTDYAFWILVFSYLWKNLGYNVVLWIAGLSTIPSSIYEAARIDGASEWKCFSKITMPNLLPSLFIICVLAIINSFKVFREAYLVAGDYPHESMYMIQHLFNNWFRELSLDKMAAAAVITSLIIVILVMFLQRIWNREK